jgi:DNA-directed RNA polymerase specialized sigma24 family protein
VKEQDESSGSRKHRTRPSQNPELDTLLQLAGIRREKLGIRQQAMAGMLEPWRSFEEEIKREIKLELQGQKARGPKGLEKLPRKKQDLSRYLDSANLTEKQRLYASLCLEYGLPIAEIARRLDRHRSTIQEGLGRARVKLNTASKKSKSRRSPRTDD